MVDPSDVVRGLDGGRVDPYLVQELNPGDLKLAQTFDGSYLKRSIDP